MMHKQKEIVEAGGGVWVGVLTRRKRPVLILFNDPETHSTLALPPDGLTISAVRAKIAKSRNTFRAERT